MHIPKEVAEIIVQKAWAQRKETPEGCAVGPTRLTHNGKTWNVRKCVWVYFYGQLPKSCIVLPKCGNKKCLTLNHIAPTRPGCNFLDGQGYHRGNRSLDDKVAQEVRKMRNLGEQLKDIAAKIDRSVNTVWSIVHGKHYK